MGLKDFVIDAAKAVAKTTVRIFVPQVSVVEMALDASDVVGKISQRNIHVANSCAVPITVVVAPNKHWVWADLGAAIAMAVASLGSSAPAGIAGLKAAKTLWDVYQATRYVRGGINVLGNAAPAVTPLLAKLFSFFAKKGCLIEPSKFQSVNKRSNSNPLDYMTPSQYGALFKASDFEMYVLTQDGRSIYFNTNSDTSWIIDDEGARPAAYGKIWQAAPDQAVKAWGT